MNLLKVDKYGETRFIYDLMTYVKSQGIPGLLVLIDFKKAFKSIAKEYIYLRF